MTITAQIIADSISPEGIRLTTMQLRYPRFIHSEVMTHRVFSRNASSSRAIPVAKMIEDLRRDPAMPVYWGSNKPGMQAGEELDEVGIRQCKASWLAGMEEMIFRAEHMVKIGLHKQIANRILEPWAHINVVCTATDYANFYALRAHKDAQPEIKELAEAMMAAIGQSDPVLMAPGIWHLPYITANDTLALRNHYRDVLVPQGYTDPLFNTELAGMPAVEGWITKARKQISVARCARVSYLTHDGRPTSVEEDLALYDRLLAGQPLHASPAEHQATPDEQWNNMGAGSDQWKHPELHGNLRGWIQHRKLLANEFVPG